jgi:hypothetical protein
MQTKYRAEPRNRTRSRPSCNPVFSKNNLSIREPVINFLATQASRKPGKGKGKGKDKGKKEEE